MYGLDLFSGIGGIGLALKPWVRTVAYCEQDRYAQGVLLSRMQSGDIDRAPIWDDITSLKGSMLPSIDIIFGGFPCQDISAAGRGAGLAGERSGLFFEVARLVQEVSPRFVFLENVPAIRTRGGETVVKTLASLGYDCRWTTLSAESVGASHIRERWFLLAHNNGKLVRIKQGRGERTDWEGAAITGNDGTTKNDSNSDSTGRKWSGSVQPKRWVDKTESAWNSQGDGTDTYSERLQGKDKRESELENPAGFLQWTTKPTVRGGVNGLPNRVDRVKCLGNSVVPLQAREALKKLMGQSFKE